MPHEPFSNGADEVQRKQLLASRQLTMDYKQAFAGEAGGRVLADLKRVYGWHRPTADAGIPIEEVYRRECMKHPLYHIMAKVEAVLDEPEKPKRARSRE